jgi:hypothetical protein
LDDLVDDGEPESGSAVISVSWLVEPGESIEHRLSLVDGDAATVVVDLDHQMFRNAPHGCGDATGRVLVGVGDDAPDGSTQLAAVADDVEVAVDAEADGDAMRSSARTLADVSVPVYNTSGIEVTGFGYARHRS